MLSVTQPINIANISMSYTSISTLKLSATPSQVLDIIELLGYKKIRDNLKVPNRIASFYWFDEGDYRSWTGVELDVYKTKKGPVKVSTRSRSSRSYWDLSQQNRTLKLLKDLFGGHFESDAGKNRYWRPSGVAPSPLSSGCYLARWRFHNNLQRAELYLNHRKLEGDIAKDLSSGFNFIDELNPRLLSNNMLVPYLIAAWEEYFRATFSACLRYSQKRESALKQVKLGHVEFEQLITGGLQAERLIAENFSFQRPSVIGKNFGFIEPKIDIAAVLRKPYRGRSQSLYDFIEGVVEDRNQLVHSGEINIKLFDKQLKSLFVDLTQAVDCVYHHIAKSHGFEPIHDY